MNKHPRKSGHNVIPIPVKCREPRNATTERSVHAGRVTRAVARGFNDKRTKEALRLARAFLAIEDAEARSALIILAERLVSYDWLRKAQQS